MKKRLIAAYSALMLANCTFGQETNDTSIVYKLDEVMVTPLKLEKNLAEKPGALSNFDATDMGKHKIVDIKDLTCIVPNMYTSDYGSRTTSAIYMRGIGNRMDQSPVGLYVDGIPYMNKSAFDFNLIGIRKIVLLRGPQGTLYGRNTMAGIIDIQTQMPYCSFKSTELNLGYGLYNDINVSASHFNKIGKVGVMVNGYYNSNDGYFTNKFDNSKIGEEWNAGGRLNLTYGKRRFKSMFTLSYDHVDQNGYAYAQLDSTDKSQGIRYNRECTYGRDMMTAGLRLEYGWNNVILSSSTSFQLLDDNMFLDNDFTQRDIFTLQQKQNDKSINEEIILKSKKSIQPRHYEHLTGVSAYKRKLGIDAPVMMKREGIDELIEKNINNVAALKKMGFSLSMQNEELPIGTYVENNTSGGALFHQSTFNIDKRWAIEAGLRADFEKSEVEYDSHLTSQYKFLMPMSNITSTVYTDIEGNGQQEYWEFLPKVTLKYQWGKDYLNKLVYASVAKGYKSGGYNSQMMSDILQYQMQKDLKEDLYYQIPEEISIARKTMEPILLGMKEIDVKDIIEYKPEYSWNYEIGTRLRKGNNGVEASVFYIDSKDQQITVFSNLGGMGRMMRNAGHTQSYGAEVSIDYALNKYWTAIANYGYTHAEFKEYKVNDSTNYKGNKVPFAPGHTFMLGINFNKYISSIGRLNATADVNGVADIYWTNDNSVKEDTYLTLNANVELTPKFWNKMSISVWGKNLTDTDFNAFYFENMGNRFVQKGKPVRGGVKVKIRL